MDRVASEIRQVLGEVIARGEIKDPRVAAAPLITLTHVRVTGDLRQALVFFTAHDADEAALERVRQGLASAAGYLRRAVGRQLRTKVTPDLTFEVDRVFEQEARIDSLIRQVSDKKTGE
jgi:ribosome-binding factor A